MVESGQLRRWTRESDPEYGKFFIVLVPTVAPTSSSLGIWRIVQDERTREWSSTTIEKWSEIADTTGANPS